LNEEKLIEILRSGDRDAFFHIIEAYNKLLWFIVGKVLSGIGTAEDIEECISDVYVKLWRNPKAYDPGKGSLKTFVAIIAKRQAIDMYRKLSKIEFVELDETTISAAIEEQDSYAQLYEAINRIKEPDKEILMRRYFYDEKPAKIAGEMSIPVKEVKNRLYQSKLKLREVIGNG